MTVKEVRGFTYPLEAARSRMRWQLDAAMAHLAAVQRQISQLEAAIEAVRKLCEQEASHAAQMWTRRPDTHSQVRALDFLASVRRREEVLLGQLVELKGALTAARNDCCDKQVRLEALDAHRADSLGQFKAHQNRKNAVEADHEWSARAARKQTGILEHG
ncbi:hypothetical protein [Caenimonas sp. SL110]|uniref:hypothetical protein n=1 Tax=Caenimonas sp. SL110 TaxID=1450524 RepID=UPI00065491CF|nr:hypothetical protein [Caenimonas sp. SL110]